MRGLANIGLALVCGCGFSSSVTPPAEIDAPKPTIDAPPEDPDDSDGDGIANASDNCPSVANPMQFNEDGDVRGDECDPCPHLAAAADDADNDGDKIGNGCDPHPNTAGDILAYWNGFHVASATLPEDFTLIHGSAARWSVAGGNLVFVRADEDWGNPAIDVGKVSHSVDTTFDIVSSFTTGAAPAAAGAGVDIKADDTDLFECQARTDAGRREMWRRNTSAIGWAALDNTTVTTPNDTYRLLLRRTPTDVPCRTTRQGQASIDLLDTTDAAGNTRAGLFARNVTVRFRYLAIYTSP